MTFRFGSWNANNRRLKDNHVPLFRETRCDLLTLQEVSADFHAELAATSLFEWSVSSLVLRPPASADGRARRLGCSVFGRSPFRSVASQLLTSLAFPERALVVRTEARRWAVTCCSFHTPPGANFGEIKPRTLKAIAEWLAGQRASIVLGIDANSHRRTIPIRRRMNGGGTRNRSSSSPTLLITSAMSFVSSLDCRPDILVGEARTGRRAATISFTPRRTSSSRTLHTFTRRPLRLGVITRWSSQP